MLFMLISTYVAVELKACTLESSSRATNCPAASLQAWIGAELDADGCTGSTIGRAKLQRMRAQSAP